MTKGSRLIKPVKVRIRFGEPYTIDYDGDREDIPREVLDAATRRLMGEIEALLPDHMRADPEKKAQWYGAAGDATS